MMNHWLFCMFTRKDEGVPTSKPSEKGVVNIWGCFLSKKKERSYPTQGEEMTLIKNVSDLA